MAASRYSESVNAHYGHQELGKAILNGLRAAGKDPDNCSYTDLATVDQFHIRGRDATLELAQLAGLQPGELVLDVGGGLGGPARTLAAEFGSVVTVLDLTEEYCEVGAMLTERTGQSEQITFKVGDALDMPFPDGSFDVVWTQHSSMNIPDKERLYAEIHRVLRPGGRLALHEVMAGEVQPVHFPVPWAPTDDISFLRPAEEVRGIIAGAGFREVAWIDTSDTSLEWFRQRMAASGSGAPPPLGLHILLRDAFRTAFQNQMRNLEENRIVVVEGVFERA
jgi:SAM-dependent methyltransferase